MMRRGILRSLLAAALSLAVAATSASVRETRTFASPTPAAYVSDEYTSASSETLTAAASAETFSYRPTAGTLSAQKPMPSFNTEAAAYALIEFTTGTMIAGQNCDMPLPMASTTKIMTALIVAERCRLDELVEVDDSAIGTEGSSMYLQKGESIKVRDLLYGLMLASGNDAAVALACHTAGSVEAFAELMNERAERLGLKNTHFVTPNGLTAKGHATTAYELCLLTREALRNQELRAIFSTQYYTTESGAYTRTFKNKNALLWDYDGAIGVKTGYTEAAGRCLSFAAEREGMTVIGVVLNCRPMFEKAAMLLDFAFENYCLCSVVESGASLARAKVINGKQNDLAVGAKNSIMALMQKGEAAPFRLRFNIKPVEAPVSVGDTVGFVTVYDGESIIGGTELVALSAVRRLDFEDWFTALLSSFIA